MAERRPIDITIRDGNRVIPGGFSIDLAKSFLEDSIEFIRVAHIRIAKDVRKEEENTGFDKDAVTIVDNRHHAPEDNVLPFGKIEYVARRDMGEVVDYAWQVIEKKSPSQTGIYKNNHVMTFNGVPVAKSRRAAARFMKKQGAMNAGDIIRLVNIAPYAGKLERFGVSAGRTKRKHRKSRDDQKRSGSLVRVPNGTYVLSARALKSKFPAVGFVKFEMLPMDYLGVTGLNVNPGTQPGGSSWRKTYHPKGGFNSGYYMLPSIIIAPNPTGVKQ